MISSIYLTSTTSAGPALPEERWQDAKQDECCNHEKKKDHKNKLLAPLGRSVFGFAELITEHAVGLNGIAAYYAVLVG